MAHCIEEMGQSVLFYKFCGRRVFSLPEMDFKWIYLFITSCEPLTYESDTDDEILQCNNQVNNMLKTKSFIVFVRSMSVYKKNIFDLNKSVLAQW